MRFFLTSYLGFLCGGILSIFYPLSHLNIHSTKGENNIAIIYDPVSNSKEGAEGDLRTFDPSTNQDKIFECDQLTSHPDDPNRMQAGIPDEKLAVGQAISVCAEAIALSPSEPRLHFQYGRALWSAGRFSEAFSAFVEAAASNPPYAAAEKFIGDAYLEGKGLPLGQEQDVYTALEWYYKSAGNGFYPAEKAIAEVRDYIAKNKFDASIFRNPTMMQALYDGRVEDVDDPIALYHLIEGMYKMLDSEQAMDHAPECKPLIDLLGILKAKIGVYGAYIAEITNDRKSAEDKIVNIFKNVILADLTIDHGQRDAVTLFQKYGCDSDIGKRIISNMQNSQKIIQDDIERIIRTGGN